MTWPFENDTSAITNKLAKRSRKADKRSKAFLLLTIALSVCMIFSIILISAGEQEEFKNTQRTKAQIAILGITDDQLSSLRQSKDVQWIGEYAAIGLSYSGNKTITVAYGSEDYFTHQEEMSLQGSLPQKANEIMLPQNYIDFLGESYRPSDTITFDVTGTGDKAEYTLSGILNEDRKSDGYFVYLSKDLAMSLMDHLQVTAYTRLNTDAIRSDAILDFTDKIIENTGIVEDQIYLTEYSAVMTGVIQSGIQLPIPMLAALTTVLAATIIWCLLHKDCEKYADVRPTADNWNDKKANKTNGKKRRTPVCFYWYSSWTNCWLADWVRCVSEGISNQNGDGLCGTDCYSGHCNGEYCNFQAGSSRNEHFSR